MASWFEAFTVTFNAGTDTTVPVAFSRDVRVDKIEIQFPSGSNGKLAIQIRAAQQQVIPPVGGQFITASGVFLDWPIDDLLDTQQWSIRGNNTGTFNHTIYVRFLCSEIPDVAAKAPLQVGPSQAPINPATL